MEAPPHLLHFRISHFNEKVRWALDHKRWPHTRQTVIPGFHIPEVRRLTGQARLPVLILDGKPLFGSNHILAELERLRPEPRLFPVDPAELSRALALQAHFDDQVAPDLRRLFWSTYLDRSADCARMATDGFGAGRRTLFRACLPFMRPLFRRNMGMSPAELADAHARLCTHFDRLESEIGSSGYLVGPQFGLADLTAAAIMTAIIRPPQFPYPLPDPWPPALVDLRASLAHRQGFQWVLDIYAKHRSPSTEVRG